MTESVHTLDDLPEGHPLEAADSDLEDHADHLDALATFFDEADAEDVDGLMLVVATGEDFNTRRSPSNGVSPMSRTTAVPAVDVDDEGRPECPDHDDGVRAAWHCEYGRCWVCETCGTVLGGRSR